MNWEDIAYYLRAMGELEMAAEVTSMGNRLEAFSDGLDKDCLRVAVLAEREECAKVCEAKKPTHNLYIIEHQVATNVLNQSAKAIRERSTQ